MPDNDPLRHLLDEWQAPPAPATLERRVFPRRSLWDWLLAGQIRVPVPVALALLVALLTATYFYSRRPPAPAVASGPAASNSADFEPVKEIKLRIIRRNP